MVLKLCFDWCDNTSDRISFSKYYTPNIQIKDFNVLTDGKRFLTLF